MTSDEALEAEKKVISRVKKLQEYDKQNLRIEEAQRSLTRAEERVDQVSKPHEPVIMTPAELRPLLTDAIQAEREAKRVLSEAKQTLASSASLLANSEQEMATLSQQVIRKETLQVQSKAEQSLLKYLRTSRDRFTQDVWAQFLVRASRFVKDCTDGRVTDLDRDEDGSFRYMEGGNWYTLAEASGCQLNLMGLAVQMALADVAPCPLNVLIADEPTDSMEEEHSLAAMVALSSCGRQVICVTHKDLDRSLFDNVHEIERK
jgi:DNA repair exonuclease SbcCD ATPase subunit